MDKVQKEVNEMSRRIEIVRQSIAASGRKSVAYLEAEKNQTNELQETSKPLASETAQSLIVKPSATLEPIVSTNLPERITVFGGGLRMIPTRLLYSRASTLFEAITECAISDFGNLKRVKVYRKDPVTGLIKTEEYNVEEIKKDLTKNVPLQPGDRIEVPEKKVIF
jgi:hypothetical protein